MKNGQKCPHDKYTDVRHRDNLPREQCQCPACYCVFFASPGLPLFRAGVNCAEGRGQGVRR